jgi:hypothetical protein
MHAQFQSPSEFGLIGNLEHVEQQRLTCSRGTGESTYAVDSHKAKPRLSSQLVTEEGI